MTRIETNPRQGRSAVTLLAIAALLFALLPAMPASADHTFNRGIAEACPDQSGSSFADTDGHTHESPIDCAAFWEIVRGFPDGNFRPNENLNRAQMATVIVNMMKTAGYEFNEDPPDAFDDTDGAHKGNIDKLADAGVVDGTGEREYSPHRPVTRGQMSTFIRNALEEVTGQEIETDEEFFDDTEGTTHEKSINELASIGVVQGTGHRTFTPNGLVPRGQTTAFVMRGGDWLADEGHWPDPATLGQSYAVEPSSATTMTAGAVRQYSVEAPEGTELQVRLFPAADVVFTPGVGTSFRDVASPSGVADHNASAARIIALNGTALQSPSQQVSAEVGEGGTVTFAVQSPAAASVIPVVWTDVEGGTAQRLDVGEDGRPKEPFGTGGGVTVIMNEAPNGESTPEVQGFDLAARHFAGTNGRTYVWSAADQFRYQGATIAQSAFEQRLSIEDTLLVTYSRDGASTFDITADETRTPPAPVAQAVDGPNANETADHVEVRFVLPFTNNPVTEYVLERQAVSNPLTSTCTQSESPANDDWEKVRDLAFHETSLLDGPRSNDCWVYRVVATAPVSGAKVPSPASNEVATGGSIDSTPPTIDDARATNDADPQGTVSEGDVHRFQFSEEMDDDITNGWYRISDPNGTIAEIVCEGNEEKTPNADCSYAEPGPLPGMGPDEPTLTVTLTGAPHVIQVGSQPGAQYPATLVALSDEWRDEAGNKVTFQGSDRVINVQ
jgi:hypothetical protein